MADEAVRLSQKICKRQPGVGLWIDQLTSRLRTRAEIRQAIGHHRAAMADAHEAITAHEAGGNPKYSLLVPDLHILLAELHAALGEREPALRHSEAIEQFRQALQSGDENTHLITARTLSRYAAIMLLLGDHERAESAARECVTILRPRIAQISRITDIVIFGRMVYHLAQNTDPLDAEAAAKLIPLMQDGIDQMARTVSPSPLAYTDPDQRDRALGVLNLLEHQGKLLTVLGAPRAAAVFEHHSYHLIDEPVRTWPEILAALREVTDEAVRLRADPPVLGS
ncbi:hypothetical protein Pmi06nite_35740 [Planotetraspora mira]|uniref:Tetratricopeptide repeat protein n=2 Tax=Planotetraspora mira TaxID=58121 RepID=A0A8J3TRS0_9ACTN|nr:hypothetical protein Pmi06nite_35740 [Planotetraspora mira]